MKNRYRIRVETDVNGTEMFFPQRRFYVIFPFLGWWEGGYSCFPSYNGALQRINNWKYLDSNKNKKPKTRFIKNL